MPSYFVCASYRKVKGKCTSHQIHNVQIEEILLNELHRITEFAKERESEFVELVTKRSESELNRQLRESRRDLEQARLRLSKLDVIVSNLYEDNLEGKISDERFKRMSSTYDEEQRRLEERVKELQEYIEASKGQKLNVDSFLSLVRRNLEITELTPEIIRTFVEKIEVFQSEKVPGTRVKRQKILIHWNYIGAVDVPSSEREKETA